MRFKNREVREILKPKFLLFENFWKGEGPFPILFAKPHFAKSKYYLKNDLVEQHQSVEKLLEDSLLQAGPQLDLIDDGIPVIRADLGTTLLPSGLGLEIIVQPDLPPWIKEHFSRKAVLDLPSPIKEKDIRRNEIMLAGQFYSLFFKKAAVREIHPDIFPYLPDTQGIFDLSHLIRGQDILMDLLDDPDFTMSLQTRSLELYLSATAMFKRQLGESRTSMIHGHGMPAGVWFPDTGTRISEDSCTLLSPDMLEKFCLPFIEKAVQPYGRGFIHFCGKHERFLEMVCEMELISTLNLGNPEKHDLESLFALLGKTGTVYFGPIHANKEESPDSYLERVADLCGRNRVKAILVSDIHPRERDEKIKMVDKWHRLTK
ncbi:MAG: hypothetical protein U9P14_01650 [Gemmatimonadota bacterium]|nr:hypothetical protein [Gemmatimonadota bacterium]